MNPRFLATGLLGIVVAVTLSAGCATAPETSNRATAPAADQDPDVWDTWDG